jgi:hypothetical protein
MLEATLKRIDDVTIGDDERTNATSFLNSDKVRCCFGLWCCAFKFPAPREQAAEQVKSSKWSSVRTSAAAACVELISGAERRQVCVVSCVVPDGRPANARRCRRFKRTLVRRSCATYRRMCRKRHRNRRLTMDIRLVWKLARLELRTAVITLRLSTGAVEHKPEHEHKMSDVKTDYSQQSESANMDKLKSVVAGAEAAEEAVVAAVDKAAGSLLNKFEILIGFFQVRVLNRYCDSVVCLNSRAGTRFMG